MTTIMIRKYTAKPRFKPHFNEAMGIRVSTAAEYVAEMKKRGLEPYKPDQVKQYKPKPYVPSQWAHDMINSARQSGYKVGDRWKNEIRKAGVKPVPKSLREGLDNYYGRGGFTDKEVRDEDHASRR